MENILSDCCHPWGPFLERPGNLSARKAILETMIRLPWRAALLKCFRYKERQNNCQVSKLETCSYWRYKGIYLTWKVSGRSRNRLLDRKSFQQLVFKSVNNRKHSGIVDCQRGQIYWPKSVFLQTQATHFETVMTLLWMKSAIKQSYQMYLFLVVFCLIVLLPNSMSKLIHNKLLM